MLPQQKEKVVQTENTPTVKVRRRGNWYYFKCQHCGRIHNHSDNRLGFRRAHCMDDTESPFLKTGYILELEEDGEDNIKVKPPKKRWIRFKWPSSPKK